MDLNRVATFVRVVETGSFTAAAAALHLPTSSVSRSVARLEADLGVILLERTTRKVSLTDAGRAYFERARDAVLGLDQASALAIDAAREPQGIVRLAVPPDFGLHLAALIAEFVRRYPRIHVDVTFTSRGAELVGGEVDVAIALGRLADSALIVRKLGATAHRLYAAPAYLDARGRPRIVADLAGHDAVLYRGVDGGTTWELVGPDGRHEVAVRGPVSGDQLQFILDAMTAGLGIGLVPLFCAASARASGALEPVLPEHGAVGAVQSLVHPSRHLPRRVTLLREFLSEHLGRACTKHAAAEQAAAAATAPKKSRRAPVTG